MGAGCAREGRTGREAASGARGAAYVREVSAVKESLLSQVEATRITVLTLLHFHTRSSIGPCQART